MWDAVRYVTNGLTLCAFLSVCGLFAYRSDLLKRERELKLIPPGQRQAALVSERWGIPVPVADLTVEQRYHFILEQLHARQVRYLAFMVMLFGCGTLLGLAAIVATRSEPLPAVKPALMPNSPRIKTAPPRPDTTSDNVIDLEKVLQTKIAAETLLSYPNETSSTLEYDLQHDEHELASLKTERLLVCELRGVTTRLDTASSPLLRRSLELELFSAARRLWTANRAMPDRNLRRITSEFLNAYGQATLVDPSEPAAVEHVQELRQLTAGQISATEHALSDIASHFLCGT